MSGTEKFLICILGASTLLNGVMNLVQIDDLQRLKKRVEQLEVPDPVKKQERIKELEELGVEIKE